MYRTLANPKFLRRLPHCGYDGLRGKTTCLFNKHPLSTIETTPLYNLSFKILLLVSIADTHMYFRLCPNLFEQKHTTVNEAHL